ncbi:MAG TPA: hypothetical protein DCG63_09670 [Methylophilaceae bacterium]|nr:hypothetical protein [Methylophilaceae bacterium]
MLLNMLFRMKRSVLLLSICYGLAASVLVFSLSVESAQRDAKENSDIVSVEKLSEHSLAQPNTQSRIVRSENSSSEEATLLGKIKAKKQAEKLKNRTPSDRDLKLVPEESVVGNTTLKNPQQKLAKSKLNAPEDAIIDKLEFNQANMLDVARALADISGMNFVATEDAAKKNVTVFLQNISVINALDTITKNSGVWYRKDRDSNTYRIMSTEEYQRDLIVYREDTTRIFNLLHPNPIIVATAIRDIYGDRVRLSLGVEDETTMLNVGAGNSGGSRTTISTNTRSNSNGTNRRSTTTIARENTSARGGNSDENNPKSQLNEKLTPDQLEKLANRLVEHGDVYALSLANISGFNSREQPIYIALNREHDLMIVRTSDVGVMQDIEQLVKEMDRPTKQVLLEMKILSLDVGDAYRQAVDIDYMPSNRPVRGPYTNQDRNPLFNEAPINVTETTTVGGRTETSSGSYTLGVGNILGLGNFALEGGTFVYQFMSDKIRARIQLLQENNRIITLSSPILLTSNNKPAKVFVGTEQVVTTGFDAVGGATNGLTASAPAIIPVTEIRNIGNTLQVMPKINADKTVTLLIQQDASTLLRGASTIPIPVGTTIQSFNVDSVRTSNIQGTVVAKDGLTVAIGGLIDSSDSEEEQKVPFLGDFPIVGEFFKRKVQEKSKRELLLLITPHIIETPHESDDVSRVTIEPLTEQQW